jgi:hypothetical protein
VASIDGISNSTTAPASAFAVMAAVAAASAGVFMHGAVVGLRGRTQSLVHVANGMGALTVLGSWALATAITGAEPGASSVGYATAPVAALIAWTLGTVLGGAGGALARGEQSPSLRRTVIGTALGIAIAGATGVTLLLTSM